MAFHWDGVEIQPAVLAHDDIQSVIAEVSLDSEKLRSGGIRNLEKKFVSIARLTVAPQVLEIAARRLVRPPRLVRALFFDKTPQKNWFVAWHQDKTVTLSRKTDIDGWRAWSLKERVWHVQPPCAVLERMLTIRLHLDPADDTSGCLKVIPESHRFGVLKQQSIDRIVASNDARACVVCAGDAVIMRPHVLHSSARSIGQPHRRVVHLEYSDYDLPAGIDWA
jgi:ectoine hydroxylase-related dioxygenase (phytanoyl-CoA dioxygenase family)